MPNNNLIVSRHKGAIDFIRQNLPGFQNAPIKTEVTEKDVRNKVVAGNIPLHLAAIAKAVWAICFPNGRPSRPGLTAEEMAKEGAYLNALVVLDDNQIIKLHEAARLGGYSDPRSLIDFEEPSKEDMKAQDKTQKRGMENLLHAITVALDNGDISGCDLHFKKKEKEFDLWEIT